MSQPVVRSRCTFGGCVPKRRSGMNGVLQSHRHLVSITPGDVPTGLDYNHKLLELFHILLLASRVHSNISQTMQYILLLSDFH